MSRGSRRNRGRQAAAAAPAAPALRILLGLWLLASLWGLAGEFDAPEDVRLGSRVRWERPPSLQWSWAVFRKFSALDAEARKLDLFGRFYAFVAAARRDLPSDARVFLAGATEHDYEFLSYYLYPREVYSAAPRTLMLGVDLDAKAVADPTPQWLRAQDMTHLVRLHGPGAGVFRLAR